MLFLSCNKEVSVTESTATSPSTGFVFIESIPTGATIYLNGLKMGQTTPDSIKWLDKGENKFILRLKGYRDSSFTINISEKQKQFITVDFTKNPKMRGSVEIITKPTGVSIVFNDSTLNQITPYKINNLLPGQYKFYLTKYSHRIDSVTAEVVSNKVTTVKKSLVDTSLWVVMNTTYCDIPTNYLTCIETDEVNNDKWIGTDQKGIVVYNDKEWKIYDDTNSPLPDNFINCIFIDNDNTKWIGTYNGGIAKFDGTTWQIFNKSNSTLPSNNITSIKKSPDNEIWVTTIGRGVSKFGSINWITYNSKNTSFPDDNINDIEFDERKNLYLATERHGVVKFDGRSSEMIAFNDSDDIETYAVTVSSLIMKDKILYAAFLDDENKIWAGIKRRIKEIWYVPDQDFFSYVKKFKFDKFNNLYICTWGNGLAVMKEIFTYKYFFNKYNTPLGADYISDIALDKNNIKWIATYGNGLVKYKSKD